MMAIELFVAGHPMMDGPIELADVNIENDPVATGKEMVIGLRNTGRSRIRKIVIKLEGDGADHVQLARDEDGPGVWASPGESIVAFTGVLMPGDAINFWSRGTYNIDDLEERLPYEYVVDTISA